MKADRTVDINIQLGYEGKPVSNGQPTTITPSGASDSASITLSGFAIPVTYNGNNQSQITGALPQNQVVANDGSYTISNSWFGVDKNDYTLYWIANSDGKRHLPGDTLTGITSALTLRASVEKNYKIEYNPYYTGVADAPAWPDKSAGTLYTIPEEFRNPTLEGYTFDGWELFSGNARLTGYNLTEIDSDVVLRAKWKQNAAEHTVNFLPGAADAYIPFLTPATVEDGADYTIPTTPPTREGYTFAGWKDEQGNNYPAGGTITNVTKDLLLTAQWTKEQVTVTYDPLPAGVSYPGAAPTTGPVAKGSDISFRLTLAEGYDPATLVVTANDVALAPVKADSNVYQYTFTANENTTISVKDPGKVSYTVMMPVGHFTAQITSVSGTAQPDGTTSANVEHGGSYTFTVTPDEGYEVTVYVNGAKQDGNGPYTVNSVTGPQRVEVVESAIPSYTVTFTVPQSGALFTQTVMSGKKATKPAVAPIREGYTFDNWYTAEEYNEENGTAFDFDNTAITADTVLYGKLNANTYTITYNLNGADGTAPTTQAKTHGTAIKLSETAPTREGYKFLGWGTTASATTPSYQPGDMYSADAYINLYAVWEINKCTVTLPGGAGYTTAPTGTNSVDWGSNFAFTVIVDREYAAKEPAVKYSTDGGTTWITIGGAGTVSDNSAATWTYTIQGVTTDCIVSIDVARNTTYTVSFITATLDNGTVTAVDAFLKQSVEHGYYAPTPAAPEREGFKFLGYYAKKDTTTSTMADYESFPFEQPILKTTDIYAIYAPIKPVITWPTAAEQVGYELKFTTPDALVNPTGNTGTVAYKDKVTFTITVAEGYDASKMQVGVNGVLLSPAAQNGNVYTFEFTAKEDTKITVVGIERKTITITYYDNARDDTSNPLAPQIANYYVAGATDNSTFTKQAPVRTGYTFLGWSEDGNATDATYKWSDINSNSGLTITFIKDTALYAIWKADATTLTLNITDVALKASNTRVIQYEGESITLQAELNVNAKGTVVFYKGDKEGTNGTRIGSAAINGKTAELSVKVGDYKTTDKNEYYWAIFESETDEGFANSEKSNIMNVGVFSKALSWKIDGSAVKDNGNVLNVYEGENATGTPITGNMIAGHTYTLEVKTDSITGVETLNTKQPALGKDYKIVWQYTEVGKNDWKTDGEASDKATYLVTGDKSGYQFRAQIVPLGPDNGSLFIKAGKFNGDTLVNDQYDTCLYTKSTNTTVRQATATALAITGAETEANNVFINGSKPFATLPGFDSNGSHLAQFEEQTVTLTATVTKDGTTPKEGVETGKIEFYRLDGSEWKLIGTVNVETQGTNTGVASTTYTMGAYDSTSAGASATTNKETFKAVYVVNETYATSETANPEVVYIKSAELMTPVIESELEGTNGAKATTYSEDLTGLLAGVQHTFTLRTTGAEATTGDYSVVALDGRTVDAANYSIEWQYKTGDNFVKANNESTEAAYTTTTTKVGDRYRVKLTGKGVFANSEATSRDIVIGTKIPVKVTLDATDEILSTTEKDVYQLNPITLTAKVEANVTSTMQPTGTVTFYYKDGENWVKLDSTTLADATDGSDSKIASIKTTKLPVKDTTNTWRNVEITAVYSGDATFNASATVTGTEKYTITAAAGCTTTNDTVTVYSSVVYAGQNENKAAAQNTDGISITADGTMASSESSVTLTLGQVYTLDHNIDLSKLTYGTDYTVQWQILRNAVQYQDTGTTGSYANTDKWEDLPNQTGSSYTGTMEQDAAYRARITVTGTPVSKGSFDEVRQTIPGRKVYYSNVLVVGSGIATVTTNITTSANKNFNEEGIVEGETATIHVIASGAAKTTPISHVTATITKQGATKAVFTDTADIVNGYTSFAWDTKGVTPGYYTLTVTAESNNGYAPQTITRTLIVRDNDYALTATTTSKVYNGKAQGIDWTLIGVDIEDALAQKSVVVYYYKDGKMVEPTQAGEYSYKMYLPASAYWTELEPVTGTFTITQRPVEVVDLIAQAKVYDGTTNANIQEIILNDAKVDETTGLPNTDTGIIDGDSVYAIGTGYTNAAAAGAVKLGVKDVTLAGDDAANYTLSASSYTEDFHIQRSQVKGALISGATYQYTGKDIKLSASDIYLIDQAGNVLTNYTVTYYYHNGDGVEKVDAMNKLGKYTVIARPEQSNYKGGASTTVYVGQTAASGTLDKSAVSTLITISNTAELYGAAGNKGIQTSFTNGATLTKLEYQAGTGWTTDRPTNAGRYLVKVTASTGDVAYGIYTITKARPVFTPTTDKPDPTYTSGRYDGTVVPGFVNSKSDATAETYVTFTGGTIQGVAYEAPTEAGEYIATVHVGETANYTSHEEKVAFEIKPAELTIKADDLQRWQYGAYPDMVATYTGLATGGVAADTSLRDVQIQPEFIFNEAAGGYTNDALDHTGNYPITVRNALARNYTITYVPGNIATTAEEPKAELAIHGMPDNGTSTENLVYYGDTIQLYAYGYYKTLNGNQGSYNTSSLIKWSVSAGAPATISNSGILTVTGVGDFTVTLTRGSGAAAISTTISVKAEKQEVKVVVPNQDNVYSGTEQKYDGSKFYAEDRTGKAVAGSPYAHDGKVRRTDVGSQIITAWVDNTNTIYQSEKYCGLFTINVKDVTVKPTAKETTYGTPASDLAYTEVTPATSDKVLTNGKAVSIADAYGNLDVYDGYEILVAGKENENYNVKYQTKNDAETVGDVSVTAKDLTVSTGTLDQQVGMTSGSLNPNGKYPVNGAEVASGTTMGPANVRMYGEPNWVMDDKLDTLIDGDSFADLSTLPEWLVKFDNSKLHDIAEDANTKYDAQSTLLSGKSNYSIDSNISVKNYNISLTQGTQNIYQRPVTLALREGLTQLNAYKPAIMPNGSIDKTALEELIRNNLVVGKYNGEGGLAELLKHTIKDLDLKFTYTTSGDTITVAVTVGNQNYYLANSPFTVTVNLDSTKIVADYGTLGWTSSTVTMYNVNEAGIKTTPTDVTGDVTYLIFTKDNTVADKYSNYKDKTPIRKVKMTKGASTGLYIANYDRLPAGEYVMFAIAEGYTIIE